MRQLTLNNLCCGQSAGNFVVSVPVTSPPKNLNLREKKLQTPDSNLGPLGTESEVFITAPQCTYVHMVSGYTFSSISPNQRCQSKFYKYKTIIFSHCACTHKQFPLRRWSVGLGQIFSTQCVICPLEKFLSLLRVH